MRSHGKCLGIGGILFDHELQTESCGWARAT
jgi:hypothetical protein